MKIGIKKILQLFVLIVLVICASCSPTKVEKGTFKAQAFKIADYGLFDLGVADINNDGLLDIFTSNYSATQSIMLNDGTGAFTDVYTVWKMDQDHHFPGLAILPEEPPTIAPGFYINWVGPDVFVRFHQIAPGISVRGRIEVLTSVEIMNKQNLTVAVSEKEISPEVIQSTIEFSGSGEGYFSFRPYNHALPFHFQFDEKVPASTIFLGLDRISPDSRDFTFQLRDRHGMAWADINNDERMDVFITRGGEKDIMGKLPLAFWDELFIGTDGCMEDIGQTAGLAKKGCPGRQAAWVDFNRDNLLDIYVVCGRGDRSHPNMLFQQTSEGRFEDVAKKVGLDIQTNGSFVWMDVDQDGDMDLFWADSRGFFVYKNENGTFLPTQIETHGLQGRSAKLTVQDYDNDGDLDVFSASSLGNILFVNTDGKFSAVFPPSVGLPEKSYTANWVDYDNDGLPDLHAVPNGLYRQKQGCRFVFTGQLEIQQNRLSPYQLVDARSSWFDVDNNGTRDLLVSTGWGEKQRKIFTLFFKMKGPDKRFGGLDSYWETTLFVNKTYENHWLQVQMNGPPGNRQAIGARVTLQTADGKQVQQVGNSEGSHYSQGHYRLYYGLGKNADPVSLHVDWPDGKATEIVHPLVDRLLKIVWQES
jgi:hypothetical protein